MKHRMKAVCAPAHLLHCYRADVEPVEEGQALVAGPVIVHGHPRMVKDPLSLYHIV